MSEIKWITDRIGVAPAGEYDRQRGQTHCVVTRAGVDANVNNYSSPLTVDDLTALGAFFGCVPWGTPALSVELLDDAAAGYPSRGVRDEVTTEVYRVTAANAVGLLECKATHVPTGVAATAGGRSSFEAQRNAVAAVAKLVTR